MTSTPPIVAKLHKYAELYSNVDIAEAADTIESLCEALTPSAETKAAYIGEFGFSIPMMSEDGEEYRQTINVPWTTVKDIMKAIRERARAALGK